MEKGVDFTKMTKAEKNFIRKATHGRKYSIEKHQYEYLPNEKYSCIEFDYWGLSIFSTTSSIAIYPIVQALTKSIEIIDITASSTSYSEENMINSRGEISTTNQLYSCYVQIFSNRSWSENLIEVTLF